MSFVISNTLYIFTTFFCICKCLQVLKSSKGVQYIESSEVIAEKR